MNIRNIVCMGLFILLIGAPIIIPLAFFYQFFNSLSRLSDLIAKGFSKAIGCVFAYGCYPFMRMDGYSPKQIQSFINNYEH